MPQAQRRDLQPVSLSLIVSLSGNAIINRLRSPLSAGSILRPPINPSQAASNSRGVAHQKSCGLHRKMPRASVSASSQGKAHASRSAPGMTEGLAMPRLRRRS